MSSYLWRLWYGLFAWQTARRGADFRCMNWGYDDPAEPPLVDAGGERYPLQLYRRVARDLPLEKRRLVEVSSGRGGGLAWLHVNRGPEHTTGIDYTPANVRLSQAAFGDVQGLEFREGRAEQLPLAESSTDVVVSVEASHCYDDIETFLDEVVRVLRPGGHFGWTDFRPAAELETLEEAVAKRFEVEERSDITTEVVRALAADEERRRTLIATHAPRITHRLMAAFAGAGQETATVGNLSNGRWRYVLYRLRRPEGL